ncbi:MAG: Amuc_1100 family pilus-like protein [Opitutaceae bacterium]
MNWFKENKFLAGLLVLTLVGAAALGFLLMSAQSAFAEAQQRYDEQAAELTRLQNSAPFPDAENLKKMEALRGAHFTAITTLQKDLAAAEVPLKPMTPEQFKDELDKTVKRVAARAAELHVELPAKEKFYMAMEKYERDVPKPEAAAPLGRQLGAMELALMQLLESRITEVTELKRETLSEEGQPAGSNSSGRSGTDAPKASSGKSDAKELVTRNSFDIAFVGQEAKFHSFINALIGSKQQFFIPKSVTVKNEKLEGPPRLDVSAVPQPTNPNPPSGTPSTEPPAASKYIVGDEKLQVSMRIDVVHFSEPVAAK